jgi:hypothetical protein
MQVIVSHYTNVLTREFNTFISDTAIRQVNNATYSSESQNVYCNENLDLKSDNEGNRAVYSVAKRISNTQYHNDLEYVCNDDYNHINIVPEKTKLPIALCIHIWREMLELLKATIPLMM